VSDVINWAEVRKELLRGRPVLLFDSFHREAEVDMVFYAEGIDSSKISYLRKHAGGLICFVSGRIFREALDLPYMRDLMKLHPHLKRISEKNPRYGDPPAFNIWVNHVNVRTGISDEDRALTIRGLAEVARMIYSGYFDVARDIFYRDFYSPGHVPILTSRGLANRKGHTELATALALLTGLTPAMVIAEMLDEAQSLPYEDAKRFAAVNNLIFIEGADIIAAAEERGLIND